MSAHELARHLLAGPDLPVIINGWSSDEGSPFEVTRSDVGDATFTGANDDANTPRTYNGWQLPRPAVSLNYD